MLNQVMQEASNSGVEVESLLLRKMDVQMCRGCLACEQGGDQRPGKCKIKDDMNDLYPGLIAADAIVLATPVYFEMVSGLLKNFLDRTCPIWPRLAGKKVAGLAVAEGGIGQTIQNLKVYAALCQMRWVGSVTVLAKNPGDAAKIEGMDKKLRRLADRVVEH
jgi:multimeric flavodoxin WrbA